MHDDIRILSYNIHSFMKFEDRLELLMHELVDQSWDLILLTETWREETNEVFVTEYNHTWFGCGGSRGRNGVGFLLHRKHSHKHFHCVSDRLGILDVCFGKVLARVVGVYMPHGGYDDEHVDLVYAQLDETLTDSKRKNIKTIIAGDFNADIGVKEARGEELSFADANPRGLELRWWSSFHNLHIGNESCPETSLERWTYKNGTTQKQLDYFLVDEYFLKRLLYCKVIADVDTGSDHRANELVLRFQSERPRRPQIQSSIAWASGMDKRGYAQQLAENIFPDRITSMSPDARAIFLEEQMVIAARGSKSRRHNEGKSSGLTAVQEEIHNLIRERRALGRQETHERRVLCKQVKKLNRKKVALRKEQRLGRILSEFRGLKYIEAISRPQKKHIISSIIDEHGLEKRDRDDIAEVFATFYERLYASSSHGLDVADETPDDEPPPFTLDELTDTLRQLKSGKSKDTAGIVAEMIKFGGVTLHSAILDLYNDLLSPEAMPPERWKRTRLVVIFKKNDARQVKNYRPIAITPILYKLFSRMLCNRVQSTIFSSLSPDQAAYRPGFSVEDHLLSLTLLLERSREWSQDLFLGLCDFEKAFDTVEHAELWKVLAEAGVQRPYIGVLKKLYAGQSANVMAGTESRPFCLQRGVKQGDPISGLLFIAVMEQCFKHLKSKWARLNERRSGSFFGVVVDDETDVLSNLRFADDVLLIAHSLADARKMVKHLADAAATYGLKLNMAKTKILAMTSKQVPVSVLVGAESVEVVNEQGCEKYLGRTLCLADFQQSEFDCRIRAAWAAFSKFRSIFSSRAYSFPRKAKLFEAAVTPVVLYGCSTWTMSGDMERQLTTTRRKMLRVMQHTRRGPDEEWVAFMKRATACAESQMTALGYSTWVASCRQRKWRFAAKVATATDNRWSKRLLDWRPFFRCVPYRSVGRPFSRWHDCFVKMAGGDWINIASSNLWACLEHGFVHGTA